MIHKFENAVMFVTEWCQCSLLKDIRVIKWCRNHDRGRQRLSGEKSALWWLCIRQVLIQIPVCCHAVPPPCA